MRYRPTAYHGLYFGPKTQPPVPTVGQPPYMGKFMANEVSMTPYDRGQYAPVYMEKRQAWQPALVSGKWHPTYVSAAPWHPMYLPKNPPDPYASGPIGNYGGAFRDFFLGKKEKAPTTPAGPQPRIVKGSAYYKYKQDVNGSITILEAPAHKKASIGTVLTHGPEFNAITAEIGQHPYAYRAKSGTIKPASKPASGGAAPAPKKGGVNWTALFGEYVGAISPQIAPEEFELPTEVVVRGEEGIPWTAIAIGGVGMVLGIGLLIAVLKTNKGDES